MNNNYRYFISAERKELSKVENDFNTELLRNILNKLYPIGSKVTFKQVFGYYDGHNEISFMIESPANFWNLKDLVFIKKLFKQDSFLQVYPSGTSFLRFSILAKQDYLAGYFHKTNTPLAELKGYTIIDGETWTIE